MRNGILLLVAAGALAGCGGLEEEALAPGADTAGLEAGLDPAAVPAVARSTTLEEVASEPFASRNERSGLCRIFPDRLVLGIIPPDSLWSAEVLVDNSRSPWPCEVRRLRIGFEGAVPEEADFDVPPGEKEPIRFEVRGVPPEGGIVLSAIVNGTPQGTAIGPWTPAGEP